MLEEDLLEINTKFDAKIQEAHEKLDDLMSKKNLKREKIIAYYDALDKKDAIDAIISEGKPTI